MLVRSKGIDQVPGGILGGCSHLIDPEDRGLIHHYWASANSPTDRDPVMLHLASHGIVRRPWEFLGIRCLPWNRVMVVGKDRLIFAMLVMMTDPSGVEVGIHRIFLTEDGQEFPMDIRNPFIGISGIEGAVCRLSKPTEELGLAVGLINAMAAEQLSGIPCWAAMDRDQLRSFAAPQGITKITVFCASDRENVELTAAHAMQFRQRNQVEVEIRLAPIPHSEWRHMAGLSPNPSIREKYCAPDTRGHRFGSSVPRTRKPDSWPR